jgi:hypothetical protein
VCNALKAWQHRLNQPLLRIHVLPQQLRLLPSSSSRLGVGCLSTLLLLWQGNGSSHSPSPCPSHSHRPSTSSDRGAACGCCGLTSALLLLLLLLLLPEPPLVPARLDVSHEAVHP